MVKNGTFASPATARAVSVFTGARRADQKHAFGDFPAQTLELLRVFQEFDNFFKLLLGFINACHVRERDFAKFFAQKPRFAATKAHRLTTAGLHLAHDKEPHADKEQEG